MPLVLSIDDFKLVRAVCELRYDKAYLLFDRTGAIVQRARDNFPELDIVKATPESSIFRTATDAFGLELAQSRLTADRPDWSLEKFSNNCEKFFDNVVETLEIGVYTRVGLRVFFRKDCKAFDEAKQMLGSMNLLGISPSGHFGVDEPPQEILFRWQNEELGTTLRLHAESATIDFVMPPELETETPMVHKDRNGIVIDVDQYTVAPVERAQWNATTWIPQSIRRIRKEVEKIISG